MVESKKKTTGKKSTTAKKKPVESKKTTPTKKVTKKTNTKKPVTSKKTAVPKKTEKKVNKSEAKKPSKQISKKTPNSKDYWKSLSVLLGVLFLILLGATLYAYFVSNDDIESETMDEQELSLTIIEDPSCEYCQVDLFVNQVTNNLFPNMTVNRISINEIESQDYISALELKTVPVFLFSRNINETSQWEENNLVGAFEEVTINEISYLKLLDQIVQSRSFIQDITLPEGVVILGNPDAKVTVIEFSDYECPYCAIAEGNEELLTQFQAQQPGYIAPMPSIFSEFIDTDKVKFVFINTPIQQLHPKVIPVHLAAMCANDQGMWKEFHVKVFNNRSDWTSSDDYSVKMKEYAVELGLDETQFNDCLDSNKFVDQLNKEMAFAESLDIFGTPGFLVNKNLVQGAQDYRSFQAIIELELTN